MHLSQLVAPINQTSYASKYINIFHLSKLYGYNGLFDEIIDSRPFLAYDAS